MNASDIDTVSFGPFRLAPATREILRNGVPLSLGDRALDILIVLVEHAGEVVAHRDLMSRAWQGLVVSPANLRFHVALLRKTLGDGEDGARYIENVISRGYCFVAPVRWESRAGSSADILDMERTFGTELVAERFISVIGTADTRPTPGRDPAHPQEDRGPYISNDVEYALHCLLFLLDVSGNPVAMSTRTLADLQGISADYVEKIFRQLHQAGIVVRAEGTVGAFALSRAPDKISFLDVVLAIDGRRSLFDCKNVRARCILFGDKAPAWATKGVCAIHAVMVEAEERMRAVFASRTLAEVAARVYTKVPPTFIDILSSWLARRPTLEE